jgi:SAM-dependent methyltransferase
VLVFNVLEHTFDPLHVLDNAMALVRPGGTCAVLTPTVWGLHSFPLDCWRINPDLYVEYARRRGLELIRGPEFVGAGPADSVLPPPWRSDFEHLYGRVIHRLFNTYGRGMYSRTHVATAAVFRVPDEQATTLSV